MVLKCNQNENQRDFLGQKEQKAAGATGNRNMGQHCVGLKERLHSVPAGGELLPGHESDRRPAADVHE